MEGMVCSLPLTKCIQGGIWQLHSMEVDTRNSPAVPDNLTNSPALCAGGLTAAWWGCWGGMAGLCRWHWDLVASHPCCRRCGGDLCSWLGPEGGEQPSE